MFTQSPILGQKSHSETKTSIQNEYRSLDDTNLYSERDSPIFNEGQTSIQDEERNNKYTRIILDRLESSQSQNETGRKYKFDWD